MINKSESLCQQPVIRIFAGVIQIRLKELP